MEYFCSKKSQEAPPPPAAFQDCVINIVGILGNVFFILLIVTVLVFRKLWTNKKLNSGPFKGHSLYQHHSAIWILTFLQILGALCLVAEIGIIVISSSAKVKEKLDYIRIGGPTSLILALLLITWLYHVGESNKNFGYFVILIPFWLFLGAVCLVKVYGHFSEKIENSSLSPRVQLLHVSVLLNIWISLVAGLVAGLLIHCAHLEFLNVKSAFNSSLLNRHRTNNLKNVKYLHNYCTLPSRISFIWLAPLLLWGYKNPLEEGDLGILPNEDSTGYQFNKFYKVYKAEQKKAWKEDRPINLWKCMFSTVKTSFILSGFYRLAADCFGLVAPLGIKVILDYVKESHSRIKNGVQMNNGTNSTEYFPQPESQSLTIWELFSNGYVVAVIILLTVTLNSTFTQLSTFLDKSEGIHIKIALQTLIYKKSLTLRITQNSEAVLEGQSSKTETENKSSTKESSGSLDSGSILNLMSEDTNNVLFFFWNAHSIWAIPLKLILLMVLLYFQLGYSALVGATTCILLMMPLQYVIIANGMRPNSKKYMAHCDERLKRMSEVLSGMKLLKLQGWEFIFRDQVTQTRNKELVNLEKDMLYGAIMTFLTHLSSVVVTVVTFGLYPYIEKETLEPSKMFAGLALFNQLTNLLFNFPNTVPVIIFALESVKRIKQHLLLPEATPVRPEDTCDSDQDLIDTGTEVIVNRASRSKTRSVRALELPVLETIPEIDENRRPSSTANNGLNAGNSNTKVSKDAELQVHPVVEIKNSDFSWENKADPEGKGGAYDLKDIDLKIPRGKLTVIVGAIGSGKSSLVFALLGEMRCLRGRTIWADETTIAYASQKPWILSASLRDNITFGKAYDSEKFSKVIGACALEEDLLQLPDLDLTKIGDDGVGLSGGQKQRVCIARALYSDATMVLLDDQLSALDVNVAHQVFDKGIQKYLLKSHRTVVLVTHHLPILTQADQIIAMESGCIRAQGAFSEIKAQDPTLHGQWTEIMAKKEAELHHNLETDGVDIRLSRKRWTLLKMAVTVGNQFKANTDSWNSSGKSKAQLNQFKRRLSMDMYVPSGDRQDELLLDETTLTDTSKDKIKGERTYGKISKKVYWSYISACGIVISALYLFFLIGYESVRLYNTFWLTEWSDNVSHSGTRNFSGNYSTNASYSYDGYEDKDATISYYFNVFVILSMVTVFLSLVSSLMGKKCGTNAMKVLHQKMLDSVVKSPMHFFDTTPIGRIITRFSSDMAYIDRKISTSTQRLFQNTFICVSAITINAVVNVWVLLGAFPLIAIYFFIQRFSRVSSRELQRLEAISRGPIYSHFHETLEGLSTIRAYRDQARFTQKMLSRIEANNRAAVFINAGNRWLTTTLDYFGNFIVFLSTLASLVSAQLYPDVVTPSMVGLAISSILVVPFYLSLVVKYVGEVETYMNSVERIKEYCGLKSENYDSSDQNGDFDSESNGRQKVLSVPMTASELPSNWPLNGEIDFNHISVTYHPDQPPIITNLKVAVPSQQKVGICGRSGSGKSTLIMALFRMSEVTDGSITIDSVDIQNVPLLKLRSSLSIIPQENILFSGKLRINLDPKNLKSDNDIWRALELCQMKDSIEEMPGQLDTEIKDGGAAFSSGQKQLLGLARALLHKSKVVVMDEATSSVDPVTEKLLLQVVQNEFKDSTVLTIAHRLDTIVDGDRVLVLNAGKKIEDGSPTTLRNKKGSIFAAMLQNPESQNERG